MVSCAPAGLSQARAESLPKTFQPIHRRVASLPTETLGNPMRSMLLRTLAVGVLLVAGCDVTVHDQAGWEARDFFTDPLVVELCEAIEADDLPAMKQAVDRGADINAIGRDGMTPLMWAFPDHEIERFRWLLEQGADPNVCFTGDFGVRHSGFKAGKSVTYLAFETEWPEYYRLVLDHGGDPNLNCEKQKKPLIFVALQPWTPDNLVRVEALVDAGANLEQKSGRVTPLLDSAYQEFFEITLLLLRRGADYRACHEPFGRRLVHIVITEEERLHLLSRKNKQAYAQVVAWLENKGIDFETAREDLRRWKSWRGLPLETQVKLRDNEAKRRAQMKKR